jgi:hypothetical protein
MPTKAETKSIRTEIRGLKSALKANQKTTQRDISANRKIARTAAANITSLESGLGRFEKETATRIAILEGRLHS